jgi:hypothetical protein
VVFVHIEGERRGTSEILPTKCIFMERCWETGKPNIITVMETSEVTFEDVEIAYQILA